MYCCIYSNRVIDLTLSKCSNDKWDDKLEK